MPEQEQTDPQQLHAIIRALVDAWCERRELVPLSILLTPWLGFSGLTDSWHNLRDALRHVRAMANESLTEQEREQLNLTIAMVDKALWRDL